MVRKHWYFITIVICPICLWQHTYRTRRYNRKPHIGMRHETIEIYDGCQG